jgi:type II secretory ATPase GspE/PulE/Tfp pilus assembly ATPase PilB-like protein
MEETAGLESQITIEEDINRNITEPLNSIITNAITERATDVHLDPTTNGVMVRFRVDGFLHEKDVIPYEFRKRVLNQVKILTNLDIDKSFMPQDGLFTYEMNGLKHDVRVTIVPINNRESIHFRFLTAARQITTLEDIGMGPEDLSLVKNTIKAPTGLILAAGGTGTGKTTTMYALANALELDTLVAVSIEDPVEFRNHYIRQVEVDEVHGLTMYEGLRVLMRTDPDVILVGEIRDKQSAVTAARAGLSGHLVLATIHARNPAMVIDVMHNMSIPRYVIGGALRLIIQQDLIRRVCQPCARKVDIKPEEKAIFEKYQVPAPDQVYEAVGCEKCKGYGYFGRVGVFEVTRINTTFGREISSGLNQKDIEKKLDSLRTQSIITDILAKATKGTTSMEVATQFISDYEEIFS